MTASSAAAGQPASPNRAERSPSFIWAPTVSRGSSACWATTPSSALTYSSARRMRAGSATHFPSSEKIRTRAAESAIAPSSASRSPRSPTVTAPTGTTSTRPASWPSRQTCSTTPAVSATGSVLAIACTAVNPPSAAARLPVSTVSVSSRPGSRRWVCRSTRPGSTISPAASTTAAVGTDSDSPIEAITPSLSTRSTGCSLYRRAPLIRIVMPFPPSRSARRSLRSSLAGARCDAHSLARPSEEQVEDGHPDADAVGDLLDDRRAHRIGHLGGDLHAAVHRAGVHDDRVVGQRRHPEGVEAVAAAVLPGAGEERGVHPLGLHPQHHHHVGLGQDGVQVVVHRRRPALHAHRQQRGRRDEDHLG